MRRAWLFLIAILLLAAATADAQIGKRVILQAGTPEEKAISAIGAATDPAEKLALIDKFLADFGQGEMAVLAYEQYVTYYAAQKNYAKTSEYAEKLLAVDPDNFSAAINLVTAAAGVNDTTKLFASGERVSAILVRYKAAPAPEGVDASAWAAEKEKNLSAVQESARYAKYQLINAAFQTRDPAAQAGLLERFVIAFPDGQYASSARERIPIAYQMARSFPKMVESAESVLTQEPKHPTLLVLLADYYSEQGTQLEKAEKYGRQAVDQLGSATRPDGVADADWQKQTALQTGVAWSSIGQVYINQKKDAQALDAFQKAAPLLKPDATSYARNEYRMGFALINLKRLPEARAAFAEAASVQSPYRALAQEKLSGIPATAARPGKKQP